MYLAFLNQMKREGAMGDNAMEISARNQIRGRVKAISPGPVMAEVAVETEPTTVTAAITASSVQRLGLKVGDSVVVIIKATEVMIGKNS
jgi:molybdopterin-binding protein